MAMNRHILIYLDKTICQILFFVLAFVSRVSKRTRVHFHPRLDGSERFLVIRPGGLGDGLMTVPFLKELRKDFPQSGITLLCVKKNQAAFLNLPFLDEIIVVDALSNLFKNLSRLMRYRFDVVFDLEPFRKMSSIVAFMAGGGIRIGFDTNNRRLLYTHLVSYANERRYESLNMMKQLEVFGITVPVEDAIDMDFPFPGEFEERATRLLASHGLDTERDFIVAVVPGVLKKHHRWRMSKFSTLIESILDEDEKVKVLLVGSPSDARDAQEVVRLLNGRTRIVNLVGKTSFIEALGVLRACKVL